MLFVQSLRGLSHTKLEDTKEEHLELAVAALDRLASKTIDWIAAGGGRELTASERGVVAGLAVGGCLTWNISNVGAVADPLSDHYGVSLAAVGLLTTALFVTHLAVQLPAGRGADRYGSQRIALVAIAAAVMGNGILLLDEGFELALLGRAVVGIGSGAAFVAGLDLVRAGGGGSALQGLYGGATMAGGGLALMVVPPSPTRRAGARPTGAPRCSRSSLPSRRSWPPASPASATPGTGCSEIAHSCQSASCRRRRSDSP